MLALIYFALAICVGDFFCRRFYRFVSVAHRCAAALLVGLLISAWFTYLAGLAFAWTARPLLWANLLFFLAVLALLSWPKWKHRIVKPAPDAAHLSQTAERYVPRPNGSGIADWLVIAGYVVLVSWMMFASFNSGGGKLKISNPEYSDFGPNTALMQSFAVGHNFPTEYPHFSGDRIRYHFLFYFQAGNLEFLGLDPAWSLNLLTITTLVAMLIVVMTLGEMLFNSRTVGRLGSLLFFFFGSLSYVPFLQKQVSIRAAIEAVKHRGDFLSSIFPYRGETWGTWSQVTYLNQRHFASAIGIFLLVLVFLVIRYRAVPPKRAKIRPSTDAITPEPNAVPETATKLVSDDITQLEAFAESSKEEAASVSESEDASHSEAATELATEAKQETVHTSEGFPDLQKQTASVSGSEDASHTEAATELATEVKPAESFRATVPGFIFSGVLLGLIPMWNSALFIAAAAVLGVLLILFPLRLQMLALAITAGLIALPQMLYLGTGSGRAPMPRLFHWGYMVDQPTAMNVAKYLGFTFGFKWLLIALALIFASWFQRRLFLAALSLLGVAFCFQFTIEVLANQKFLHLWVIIANLFVAFALWRLWRLSLGGTTLPGKFVATVLFLLVIPGGVIDFFPIHNTGWSEVQYRNDPLIDWLNKNTKPRDIFLTDRFVTHPILMAGRRVLYGWPYYGWSAGYDASKHDKLYTELFEGKDPWKVYHLLKDNGIKYVVYDNAVRQGQFIKRPNEQLYATYFPKVFEDSRYNGLVIYKVPDTSPPKLNALPEGVTNMFEGGRGTGKGEFDLPSGMCIDGNGNILVADTGNGRIEKFSPTGTFLSVIASKGSGHGQLGEPNGIAVDRSGNIYVAEVASNHRVQKLAPDGTFIAEWKGPDVGFYGPRRIAIGPDDSVYVDDQGRTRIVKLSPDGHVLSNWGSKGSADGQFNDPTSVAVDSTTGKVYVADPINKRIQVFDQNGKFLTKWLIPEWGRPAGFEDLAIDSKAGRLYASSANMDAVLVFDLSGTRIGTLAPKPPDRFGGPSALALFNRKLYVLNMYGNSVSAIDL
ncbi:MAG TPA: NHL repeat-containing protein [Candidatus Acidoferrum sp.]|nr:NHL repeat-containing protein [Candidatus Acidoferrum sp.]